MAMSLMGDIVSLVRIEFLITGLISEVTVPKLDC